MKCGKLTRVHDIPFPASEVWQVYASLELHYYLIKTLPNFYKHLKVTGAPFEWYKEVDVDVIGTGYLNFGYRTRLEVHYKGPSQCTVSSIVMYEMKDEFADNEKIATVDDTQVLAMAMEEYVKKKRAGGGSVLDGATTNGPSLVRS